MGGTLGRAAAPMMKVAGSRQTTGINAQMTRGEAMSFVRNNSPKYFSSKNPKLIRDFMESSMVTTHPEVTAEADRMYQGTLKKPYVRKKGARR